MTLKKFMEFLPGEKCCFCNLNKFDVLYGPIYKYNQKCDKRNFVVHYFCLLMASKIEQNGRDNQGILGFFPKDIIKELNRGKLQSCTYCGKNGATVHCISTGCHKMFHLPCGVDNGSLHQFFDLFQSFCHFHRPKQSISNGVIRNAELLCIICCLKIDKQNKYHIIWPTCCKPRALLHRKCLQTMANNSGYYFKCPFCNDTELFKTEIQRLGIYVPEQEASWESEPHAYEELLVRGSGCEAKSCSCPQGRNTSKKNSSWQLELCTVCGGNGIHLGCTEGSESWNRKLGYQFDWICEICKPVFLENKASATPEHSSVDETAAVPVIPAHVTGEDSNDSATHSSASTGRVVECSIVRTRSDEEDSSEKTIPGTSSVAEAPLQQTSILEEEDDIVVVDSEDESQKPSAPDSSDDDCTIVGVICSKRRKRELLPMRKRFRTAKWVPPENGTGLVFSKATTVNVSPTKMNIPSSKVGVATPGSSSASTTNATIASMSFLNQPKTEKLNQLISAELQMNQSKRPNYSSPHSKKSRDALSKQSKSETSLPTDVSLNLSEVSINKLQWKPSLPSVTEVYECIRIDDSSSEDEAVSHPQNVFSGSLSKAGVQQVTTVPTPIENKPSISKLPSQLRDLLSKVPSQTIFKKENLDHSNSCSNAQLKKPDQPRQSNKEFDLLLKKESSSGSSRNVKLINCPVTFQVILSSDDEEIESVPPQLPLESKKKNGSPLNSTRNTQNSFSSSKESKCLTLGPVKVSGMAPQKGNNVLRNSAVTCRKISSDSDSVEEVGFKAKSTESPLPILQSALSVVKRGNVKPDILIVSDDDDDDDVQVESVHMNNIFTSDRSVPETLTEQPTPTQVFLSEDMCPAPEEYIESPESPSDLTIHQRPAPLENNTTSSCIGVISEVKTLANAQFEFKDDSSESNDLIFTEQTNSKNDNNSVGTVNDAVKSDCTERSNMSSRGNDSNTSLEFPSKSNVNSVRWRSRRRSEVLFTAKLDGDESSSGSHSDQVVSSTVPSTDNKNELNVSSSAVPLCACVVSCSCNIPKANSFVSSLDHKESNPVSGPLSVTEESVTSTTDSSPSFDVTLGPRAK